jgi:hypothetical protein
MKRTLIALVLAFGATAAVADPTLSSAQNQQSGWSNAAEATAYRAATSIVDDNAADYPFNP